MPPLEVVIERAKKRKKRKYAQKGAAVADSTGLRIVPENDMEFHQQWVYSKPQDILPYIYATAAKGQPEEVLQAMDEFGRWTLSCILSNRNYLSTHQPGLGWSSSSRSPPCSPLTVVIMASHNLITERT